MLLEKLRGAAPKLLDKSTFDDNVDDYPSQPTDANSGIKETEELKISEQKESQKRFDRLISPGE